MLLREFFLFHFFDNDFIGIIIVEEGNLLLVESKIWEEINSIPWNDEKEKWINK